MGLPVLRRIGQNARPPRRQGRRGRGDDESGNAGPARLHDHDRGLPRLLQARRQVPQGPVGAGAARPEGPRAQGGQEVRRPEGPVARQRAVWRQVLDARDDGHGPQPRPERGDGEGPGRADQGRALRPRRAAPLRPDVRQDGQGHRRRQVRARAAGGQEEGQGQDRPRIEAPAAAPAGRPVPRHI